MSRILKLCRGEARSADAGEQQERVAEQRAQRAVGATSQQRCPAPGTSVWLVVWLDWGSLGPLSSASHSELISPMGLCTYANFGLVNLYHPTPGKRFKERSRLYEKKQKLRIAGCVTRQYSIVCRLHAATLCWTLLSDVQTSRRLLLRV